MARIETAWAVIIDANGRLLLAERADKPQWNFPGGHVDAGETIRKAAIRETMEEVGVNIARFEYQRTLVSYLNKCAFVIYRTDKAFRSKPNPKETKSVRRVSPDRLSNYKLHRPTKLFNKLLRQGKITL